MELSKLRSYFYQENQELEEHCKEIKHMFDEYSCQINEIDRKIKMVEDNFDFAYEAFSPISQEQKMQSEIEKLEKEKEDLKKEQLLLQKQIDVDNEKKKSVKNILDELDSVEDTNRERIQNMKKNYDRILGAEIIEGQEKERQRIARDLHDTTVQNLTAMIHKLEFCQQIVDADVIRAKIEMQLMMNTIRETVEGMRQIIYDLRPMSFDDIGFKDTLLRAVEKLQKNSSTKIEFCINGDICKMNPAYELTILRIIQEAINNTKKHSQAEKAEITLTYEEKQIVLEIHDNGKGFDFDEKILKQQNSGFGISMMKERVYLLKGQMEIHSEKNKGTDIKVFLPKTELEGAYED